MRNPYSNKLSPARARRSLLELLQLGSVLCEGVLTWVCQNVVFFTLQCSPLNVCQSMSARCRVGVLARGGSRSPRCAYRRRWAIFVNCLSSGWVLAFRGKGLCAHDAVSERQASRAC